MNLRLDGRRIASVLALLVAFAWIGVLDAIAAAPAGCVSCHADFAKVLPASHPAVKGGNLAACLACHKPTLAAKAVAGAKPAPSAFAAALHRAHGASVDCATCHAAQPKGRYGVANGKVVLPVSTSELADLKKVMIAPDAQRWTAGLHAAAKVDCRGCHDGIPKSGAEVDNGRCLACHGPADALEAKTAPAQFADRNPHKSHLGDIACAVCHKGHEASAVYCLDCHKKFVMTIKGAAAR